jgi:hypothetical protein
MLTRLTRVLLLSAAATIACGCDFGPRYNEPADPSQDAAAIGANTAPQTRVGARRKKVNKPPGPATRDARGVRSVQ